MSFIVVIPARFASTRLPGKPLLEIAGKPMIQRVVEQARKSSATRVVVATDDERIREALSDSGVSDSGVEVLMTRADHPSGTDRLQEVAAQLELDDEAVVVNVQGDEPMIPPVLIDQVANNLIAHPEAAISTLCERIHDLETAFNPNAVKVVFDQNGFANYFSRAPIPWARDLFPRFGASIERLENGALPKQAEYYRHIGIYGYRVNFLHDYVRWSPSMTEQTESLEQLRALSNGARIHVEVAEQTPPAGVDTPEDLARVRDAFER